MWTRLRAISLIWGTVFFSWAASGEAQVGGLRGARVTQGQLAPEGDMLVAGSDGATLALEQGASLHANPGARFRFHKFMKLPMGSGPDPMVQARVLTLEQGYLTTSVPDKRRYAVLMMGPRKLRAILSEGQATLIATEARSTVAALEGKLLITMNEKWRYLPAGNVQIAIDGYPDGLRRSILDTPGAPVLSRRLLLEGAPGESSTSVSWPALTGAVEYDVELTSSGGALVRQLRTREPQVVLGPFAAGDYRVSVRAIDDSGLPGARGTAVGLNVVGLDVPKTASRAPSGVVRLQPGQRVGLLGAEGLEVGYLGLDDFLPAPKTLGLVARRPIAMNLRHPGSGEVVRLQLEPMTVRAEISFARHPHSWPKEGLPIEVKLIDENGYEVPEAFRVACKVTVNIESAEATWERSGSGLRALLPQPEGPGPWMVRVEVVDEGGVPLGKDFSEVGYASATAPQAQRR